MTTSIVIFGEILADMFPQQTVLGGAPYNVARHLHALGLPTTVISRLGQDPLGEQIREEMRALNMPTHGLQIDPLHPTGQVQVVLSGNTHRFDILPDQAYDYIDAATAVTTLKDTQPQLIYFGSLAVRNTVSFAALQTVLAQYHCPRFLDINLRAPWFDQDKLTLLLTLTDHLKLNDEELAILAALFGWADESAETQARKLQSAFKLTTVIVTCGAQGAWMLDAAQSVHHSPETLPLAAELLVDTVGAGDAFSAVCIMGLTQGWHAEKMLIQAHALASAICTVRGAAPSNPAFYEKYR